MPRRDPLEDLSRDQLLDLARRMLAEEPRLDRLPPKPPVTTRTRRRSVEVDARKRIRDAFRFAGFVNWRNEAEILAVLDDIHTDAKAHAASGDPRSAFQLLAAAASEVANHFDQVDDSNGVISGEVRDWIEELPVHIAEPFTAAERKHWIDVLLEFVATDYGLGDMAGQAIAALAHHDPDESKRVEEWCLGQRAERRARYPELSDYSTAVDIQLDLYAALGRWDECIELARSTRRWKEYAHIGLNHGLREEEVVRTVARGTHARQRCQIAEWLVPGEHRAVAEELFRSALAEEPSSELAHRSLADLASEDGRLDEAEAHLQKAIADGEGSVAYDRLRALFDGSTRWDEIRATAHATLREGNKRSVLVHALLAEGDTVEAAREALDLEPKYSYHLMRSAARAVEEVEPDLAVQLYTKLAAGCIDLKGRQYYRIAVDYLARVRELLNASSAWNDLIEGLRETHKRKTAFIEELRRKKL